MIDILYDARAGGDVERYHTWRTAQRQTCAHHMWNVARILLSVWPDAPRKLVVEALFHDAGEMCGDVPYPFKRDDPVLKERMDAAELRVRDSMSRTWGLPDQMALSDYEHMILKICDYLEMWEFGITEVNLGNKYAEIVVSRTWEAVNELYSGMDGSDPRRVAIVKYVRTRMDQEKL